MGIAAKHLGESRRAEIAGTLFTVTSTEEAKGEIHGLCPIHGPEKNPSFAYNFKKDLYHCLACGADGDLLRRWAEVKGLGQTEGFKASCEAVGIPLGEGDGKGSAHRKDAGTGEDDSPEMQIKAFEAMEKAWESFPPLPDEWIARLVKTRGWSRRWIEILDIRMQTHRFTKKGELAKLETTDRIAIPILDIFGRLKNIRLYKPGAAQYKIISWARSTGKNALFPAMPLFSTDGKPIAHVDRNSTPTQRNDGARALDAQRSITDQPAAAPYILLCEGESDTICALSHGFNAITQTAKVKKWPDEQLLLFKGHDVVIAYDADEAGVKYAAWACQARTAGAVGASMAGRAGGAPGLPSAGAVPCAAGRPLR